MATDGQLSWWIGQKCIEFKHAHGMKSSGDTGGSRRMDIYSSLPQLLRQYQPKNVCNAGKTGIEENHAMNRITVVWYVITTDSSLW